LLDGNAPCCSPDIGVHCPRHLLGEVREALTAVGFEEETNPEFHFEFGSAARPNSPAKFFFPRPSYAHREFIRGASASTLAAFAGGKAVLSITPPTGFTARTLRYVRLVFDNLPLPLPVTRSATRRIHDMAEASDGVMLKTVAQASWPLDVRLPTAGQALEDWVKDHGFALTRSQDGRDAEALLRRLGSLDQLDVLADRKRLAVLQVLTPRSRVKLVRAFLSEAKKAGGQLDAETIKEQLSDIGLFLEIGARTASEIAGEMDKGVNKEDVLALLPPLIEAGFVRRVREVVCSQCHFRMLLTLAEQDEVVRCRACGAAASLPVVDKSGRQEPELFYRLDGLMARMMDQDVLPVLLTLRALKPPQERGELFFGWPGVEVKKGTLPKVDIDLLVSSGASRVRCFEVKKNAGGLKAYQLDKLLTACSDLGASPGLAAIEGAFPDELAAKVREAAGQVLTAEQLFA
jgi:hypothetical protein